MEIRNSPKVTVLMPVYNGKPYIREAVLSVLGQSFDNFELLIIDDCSSDNGMAELATISDGRIVVVRNDRNMGLAATLNKGVDMAKGELIARMDVDDIACRDRLRMQVELMESHPDVALCGCGVEMFFVDGRTHNHYFPLSYSAIKAEAMFNSPVSHPGAMIRKSILLLNRYRYDETPYAVEDYDLFSRIIQRHKAVNLPHFLLRYRVSGNNETARADAPERAVVRKEAITRVQLANLAEAGIQPTQRQLDLHYQLSLTERMKMLDLSLYPLNEIKTYLYAVRKAMIRSGYSDKAGAKRITGKIFLKLAIYKVREIRVGQLLGLLGSALLWGGVWDTMALRIDYLLKRKRI